jgi:hypothetical protein
MKQFYSAFALAKKLQLLFVLILGVSYVSKAQVYWASLSGLAESPSNNSPGIGTALVTISGTSMRVQVTFSGLVGQTTTGQTSGTTASHIHAPTATAGTGTAGVATTTPTFTGFPLGVRSGTYDHIFDLMQNSSYNPAYLTANGGNAASAIGPFLAALAAGKSYLNVHSNAFPAGEIRGFLTACPLINVSIPDAFALTNGVLPNTVYPAYSPASSLTLQSNVSGGTWPYNYSWSNNAATSSITVSPMVSTTYSLWVTDMNGCPGTASKTVNVVDISDGKKGDKILVCHNGKNALSIATPAVAAHLQHGDMLGTCQMVSNTLMVRSSNRQAQGLAVKVLANPSPNSFDLQIQSDAATKVRVTVYDYLGRIVEARSAPAANQTLRIGNFYKPGTYLVEIVQGAQKQTLRLVKAIH